MRDKLTKLAEKYGIKIIDCAQTPEYYRQVGMPPETFENRSFQIGKTIIMGIYDDVAVRELGFLHELGHSQQSEIYTTKAEAELKAWQFALKEYGRKAISPATVEYILDCLETYCVKVRCKGGINDNTNRN